MIDMVKGDAMEVTKIFFDMDGVLADFDRGLVELCGLDPQKQGTMDAAAKDELMWKKIRETEHFYDRLELIPGMKDLFDEIYGRYGDKCEILTAVPKPKRGIPTAGDDKTKWVRRLLSEKMVINIVIRQEKYLLCKGKDCILIDDFSENINKWNETGGTGVLFTSTEDCRSKLKELGVL